MAKSSTRILVDIPGCRQWASHFLLAADGISRTLVLLTGLPLWPRPVQLNIELRTNEFFAFFSRSSAESTEYSQLRSISSVVFYEIAIVPKYFLIAIWGSTRREYAAMKLALYSFVGSAMVLIGLLAAYATSGSHSTSLVALAHAGLPVSSRCGASRLSL